MSITLIWNSCTECKNNIKHSSYTQAWTCCCNTATPGNGIAWAPQAQAHPATHSECPYCIAKHSSFYLCHMVHTYIAYIHVHVVTIAQMTVRWDDSRKVLGQAKQKCQKIVTQPNTIIFTSWKLLSVWSCLGNADGSSHQIRDSKEGSLGKIYCKIHVQVCVCHCVSEPQAMSLHSFMICSS